MALAKLIFHRHPGGGIVMDLLLLVLYPLGGDLTAPPWAAQRWARKTNPFAGTIATILTGTINLIDVHRGQIMAIPSMKGFDLGY